MRSICLLTGLRRKLIDSSNNWIFIVSSKNTFKLGFWCFLYQHWYDPIVAEKWIISYIIEQKTKLLVGCFFILTNWTIHTILHRYFSFTFYVGSPDQFYTFFDLMILDLYDLYVIFQKRSETKRNENWVFLLFQFHVGCFQEHVEDNLRLVIHLRGYLSIIFCNKQFNVVTWLELYSIEQARSCLSLAACLLLGWCSCM